MLLLQLPTEILIEIFDHVGSSYFRSDLSRLIVCKQWNEIARTACFRDFYVTQNTLERLFSYPNLGTRLALVKDSAKSLHLDLKGFEDDWDSVMWSPSRQYLGWDDPYVDEVRAAWTTELNNHLYHLATIVKQSQKLRILRIQATSEVHPRLECSEYLYLSTIRTFLPTSNLTSLELDLCGTRLISRQVQDAGEGFHFCTSIAALLTTVRRLRLRMRTICADILKPRQHKTNLRLNDIVINLSLSNESPRITSAAHATCCGSSPGGLLQLKADMEEQAQVLVAHTAAPKMVRILMHALPSVEMRAFDVLTGRILTLSDDAEWDADGEAVEEQVWDEESEISDLSSDNDG